MGKRVDLLANASATGAAQRWPGGRGTWVNSGTLGGATIHLEFLGPDGSAWLEVAQRSAIGVNTPIELAEGQIRTRVNGGTPSGLFSSIVQF